MRIVIISQARMTSTRLPGKVLKEVLGKPLLEYHIERLQRVRLADELVIATTVNDTDQPIVDLCERLGVKFFRGSEEDVLSRYYYTAIEHKADAVVRVTSDCPLIDPKEIDKVIKAYKDNHPRFDYVANTLTRTYPRGMDTEVFSMKALKEAFEKATEVPQREHVTPFIHRQPDRYKLLNVEYKDDFSFHRWTVDTIEDFALIKILIEELYPKKSHFSLEDCLEFLERNPEWIKLNAHIEQKVYGQ